MGRRGQIRTILTLIKLAAIAIMLPFTVAAIWNIWRYVEIAAR